MPQSYYTEILTYRILNTESGRTVTENKDKTIINRGNILYITDINISDTINPESVDGKLFSLSMSDGTRLLISKPTFNEVLFSENGGLIEIKPVTIVNGTPTQNISVFLYLLTIREAINTIRPVIIDGRDGYRMQMKNRSQLTVLRNDLDSIIAAAPVL
jgi:hypothetical protein